VLLTLLFDPILPPLADAWRRHGLVLAFEQLALLGGRIWAERSASTGPAPLFFWLAILGAACYAISGGFNPASCSEARRLRRRDLALGGRIQVVRNEGRAN
jgi:hypothetical protein